MLILHPQSRFRKILSSMPSNPSTKLAAPTAKTAKATKTPVAGQGRATRPLVHDIIVVGAGLAGLIQTRMLQRLGLRVHLVDPRERSALLAPSNDRRASTLTPASVALLELPQSWLVSRGQRIETMVVDAGVGPQLTDSEALRLESGAWVVSNSELAAFLVEDIDLDGVRGDGHFGQAVTASATTPGRRLISCADGSELSARLVIAADGRHSILRRADKIQQQVQDFRQTALTGIIHHEAPHEGRAFQRFLRRGTFALLPLPGDGHSSSFIWVEPSASASTRTSASRRKGEGLFSLEAAILIERMQARIGDTLGRLSKTGNEDWGQFPLFSHSCDRITGERLALIGEAAHSIHPLAGQGLNLSIKDAAALTSVIVEQRRHGLDHGDAQALERYQRARRAETTRMAGLTAGLNALFTQSDGPLRAVAAVGLRTLDRIGPLKAVLEREARR